MIVAEVKYTGTMRSQFARGYKFSYPSGQSGPIPTDIYSVEDAEWFERQDVYEVEWTSQGKLARKIGGHVDNAKEALEQLGYRQKQKLVKAYEVNIRANAGEEELDEALEPIAEEMVKQMEVQQ